MLKVDSAAVCAAARPEIGPRNSAAASAAMEARVQSNTGTFFHNTMTSAALSQAYQAARTHAALLPRHGGRIVVSGRDRATYLQGLLTNDIRR